MSPSSSRPFIAALLAALSWSCADAGPKPSPPIAVASVELPPPSPAKPVNVCAPLRIRSSAAEAPSAEGVPKIQGKLDGYFEAVARLMRGNAKDHVRIAAFGDSNLTMDYPTGHLRRILQKRLGDGGHGFVALGQPWSHYQHMDVVHGIVSGWKAYAITTSPIGDGLYGLGGIAVENQWQGSHTMFGTARADAPVGGAASRLGVLYLKKRRGGEFAVEIDGQREARVSTKSDVTSLGYYETEATLGPHSVHVVSASPDRVRVFGGVLETSTPGIVIDTFGVGAMNSKTITKSNADLFRQMLAQRRYDLVVFMTGANDVFTIPEVPDAMHEIMERVRVALPEASILVLTPADRGRRKSFPQTLEVIAQRERIAEKEGVGFWNLHAAMGGKNSMASFVERGLAHDDAIHYTSEGGRWIAERFDRALTAGFDAYMIAHPGAGCVAKNSPEPSSSN